MFSGVELKQKLTHDHEETKKLCEQVDMVSKQRQALELQHRKLRSSLAVERSNVKGAREELMQHQMTNKAYMVCLHI